MQTVQEQESHLVRQDIFDLVKGDFTPEEALEIINHLLTTKINFHNLQIFSKQVRSSEVDKNSIKRIEELEACKASIRELALEAKRTGKSVRLKSTIQIELL